jgi:N-acetyltransferase
MAQPVSPFSPVLLEGNTFRLEPLRPEHESLFWEAAKNDLADIFRWIPYPMQSPDDFRLYMNRAFTEQNSGLSVVFATVERSTGTVIGSTRFMNIDVPNRKAEIGSTWIAPRWQRTACNTEAKFLMLQHAFEVCHCIRVELKTDALNQKSRNAILRIGAKEEGTLRQHLITYTGRVRDSVCFSILEIEWPEVKRHLQTRLNRA